MNFIESYLFSRTQRTRDLPREIYLNATSIVSPILILLHKIISSLHNSEEVHKTTMNNNESIIHIYNHGNKIHIGLNQIP